MKIEIILALVIVSVFVIDFILRKRKKASTNEIENFVSPETGKKNYTKQSLISLVAVILLTSCGFYYYKNYYVPEKFYNQIISLSSDHKFIEAQKKLNALNEIKPSYRNIDSLRQDIIVSQAIIELSKNIITTNIIGKRYNDYDIHLQMLKQNYYYDNKDNFKLAVSSRRGLSGEPVHRWNVGRGLDWDDFLENYNSSEVDYSFVETINFGIEKIKKLQESINSTEILIQKYPSNGDLYYLKYGLLRSLFHLKVDHTFDYFIKNDFSFRKKWVNNIDRGIEYNARLNYFWNRKVYSNHWEETQYLLEKVIDLNSKFSFDAAVSLSNQFLSRENQVKYEFYLDKAESINKVNLLKYPKSLVNLSRKIKLTDYKIKTIKSYLNGHIGQIPRSWKSRFSKETDLNELLNIFVDHLNTIKIISNNSKSNNIYYPALKFFQDSMCRTDCNDLKDILIYDKFSILESSLLSLSNIYFLLFAPNNVQNDYWTDELYFLNVSVPYDGFKHLTFDDAISIKDDYCSVISKTKKLRIKDLSWYKQFPNDEIYRSNLKTSDYINEICK